MAVDEALLAAATTEDITTLRLYQWSEPTLSLGYFQRYADRESHAASRDAAVVRRPSGGGAILHDHELTYSIVLPGRHRWTRDAERLYRAVHEALAAMLVRRLGSRANRWAVSLCPAGSQLHPDEEPFLCFQRRAAGDVVVAPRQGAGDTPPWKVVGSAQRRRAAVLQHGSVLLRSSPAAPELPGFCDLTETSLSPAELESEFATLIPPLLGAQARLQTLPGGVEQVAAQLADDKYSSRRWTERR